MLERQLARQRRGRPPRFVQCPVERGLVAIAPGHVKRRLPRPCRDGREGNPAARAGFEPDAPLQRHHRIEGVAEGAGKPPVRSPGQRLGPRGGARAAEEGPPVGLEADVERRGPVAVDAMQHDGRPVARTARTAGEEQPVHLGQVVRLDEEAAEGRVTLVVLGPRQTTSAALVTAIRRSRSDALISVRRRISHRRAGRRRLRAWR